MGVCTGPGCPPEERRVRCAGSSDQTRLCPSSCIGTSVPHAVKRSEPQDQRHHSSWPRGLLLLGFQNPALLDVSWGRRRVGGRYEIGSLPGIRPYPVLLVLPCSCRCFMCMLKNTNGTNERIWSVAYD